MSKKLSTKGFSVIETVLVIVVVAVIGFGGWYIWHSKHAKTTSNNTSTQTKTSTANTNTAPTDPYAGWKAYVDTGYTKASGITVKYPSDWQIKVGESKAFAWQIIQNSTLNASIGVRDVFLNASKTPQDEWDNCPSADACGPIPGDTKLEGNSSTINGLDNYNVKMQSSSGIYYATVIKGSKPASNGTVVFVEFILRKDDPSVVNIYKQIVASANF